MSPRPCAARPGAASSGLRGESVTGSRLPAPSPVDRHADSRPDRPSRTSCRPVSAGLPIPPSRPRYDAGPDGDLPQRLHRVRADPLGRGGAMLVTSDPGVAHTWLRTTYPGYVPEESNSRRNFLFQAVHEQAGRSGISRLSYSMSADNNVAPDVILVVRPSAGAMMVRLGREEVAVPPGAPVLLPARQAVSVLWVDTEAGCICLSADDVERVAVETPGLDSLALRFTGLRPMLPGLDRRWNDTVQAVTRVVR